MSESIGARLTRESFEKHQREIAEDARDNATVALSAIDKANDLEQRLARIAEILRPEIKQGYDSQTARWGEGRFCTLRIVLSIEEAKELQALLEGTWLCLESRANE